MSLSRSQTLRILLRTAGMGTIAAGATLLPSRASADY